VFYIFDNTPHGGLVGGDGEASVFTKC